MAACPTCHLAIEITEKQMGALFTCPHCRSVFFVGWDGQPEVAPSAEEIAGDFISPAVSPHAPLVFEPLPEAPLQPESESEPDQEMTKQYEPSVVRSEALIETVMADVSAITPEPEIEAPYDFGRPLDAAGEEPVFDVSSLDTPEPAETSLDEVADYGNTSTQTGPLRYLLTIRGLELAQTVRDFREALTDSRFAWDVEEIMSHLRGGELRLKPMSPTKASILINRIKSLPIEVSWRQEVYGEVSS